MAGEAICLVPIGGVDPEVMEVLRAAVARVLPALSPRSDAYDAARGQFRSDVPWPVGPRGQLQLGKELPDAVKRLRQMDDLPWELALGPGFPGAEAPLRRANRCCREVWHALCDKT